MYLCHQKTQLDLPIFLHLKFHLRDKWYREMSAFDFSKAIIAIAYTDPPAEPEIDIKVKICFH